MKVAHANTTSLPEDLVSVVLPIRNQSTELPRLLRKLGRIMDARTQAYHIIVVDDGSTDQTARVAAELARRFPVTVVSHTKGMGVGKALRTGLFEALPLSGTVITMDPDKNHDPVLIPRMLEELENGNDIVIASRFNRRGIESGMGKRRRVLRGLANGVLRSITPLRGVRDHTSGFQAYRSELLQRVVDKYGKDKFLLEGDFASRLEILLKATSEGAKIVEVPLVAAYDHQKLPASNPMWLTIRRYGEVIRRYRRSRTNLETHAAGDNLALDRRTTVRRSEGFHRALSLVVAFLGIVATAPVMALVGLAVKLTSRGPVFFAQTRIGIDRRRADKRIRECRRSKDLGGRPFQIYKFRTMKHCPDAERQQVWASPDDPRVTAVGRVLRKFRFDELPQLFNVLFGTMNIVGPRPEQPKIFGELRTQIGRYDERQQVPPGITGWAQVTASYDQTVDDVRRKVELDLEYVARRSVVEDLKIMFRTIPVVLLQRGAW